MTKKLCPQLLLATGILAAVLTIPAQAGPVRILFVGGGDSSAYLGADGNVRSFLQEQFYYADVDYLPASAATTASANGYDLLVISSTPDSGSIRNKWRSTTTNILNWEQAVVDDDFGEFMMADSVARVTTASGVPVRLDLTNTSHPIAAGFASGPIDLAANSTYGIYYCNTLPAGVASLGTQADVPSNHMILAADKGALLRDGSLSPNRRVMFPMEDNAFNNLTEDGKQLFAQAATWAGDLRPVLVEYRFPTQHGSWVETGSGFSPTKTASLLDLDHDMAVRDTAGKVALEITDPVSGTAHYATQPVLRVAPAEGATNLDLAVEMDSYFEFSLAPMPGYRLDLAALEFDAARGGNTQPRGWGLFSSVDGFSEAIASEDLTSERATFTHVSLNLNRPQFQDLLGPVTFRMYVYSPSNGATIEFDNFELIGRVAVPEPATLGLLLSAAAGLAVVCTQRRRPALKC